MAKTIKKVIKVQAKGGQANPAPPLGPALGQAGVDIGGFCSQFNEQTKDRMGQSLPVEITVYDDRSFSFKVKVTAMADLIKQELKITSGSGEPNKKKVGKLTMAQITAIAERKMPDLNANDIEAAKKIVIGTARSMGVEVA
ncbi:MAG: large subunit ribosomal protein [Candidatus Peribacteria bacterium]|nr:large subunit ribosomal protein [Candidatus Peribacteria bacterium]